MKKRITIDNVAEKAGVSKGAVWAALSKSEKNIRLAPETKKRILEVTRELGYQPNIMAQGLNCRKSFLIGFFFSESNWHVSTQLIRSIRDICYTQEYSLIIYPSSSLEEERRNLELSVKRQLDGMLTIPFISDDGNNGDEYIRINRDMVPVMQIIFKLSPEIPFVGIDYRKTGSEAVEYLIQKGHRRISLITFSNYKVPLQGAGIFSHYEGYMCAMNAAGLQTEIYPASCASNTGFNSGYEAAEGILSSSYAPTAVIAKADSLAYGMITRFKELGVRIPEDISIIGCADDMVFPECLVPELTNFSVPFKSIGDTAFKKCLNLPMDVSSGDIYLYQKFEKGETVRDCGNISMPKVKEGVSI
ncbi:MAG: hypothetical protein A2020_03140 [Lentisphaerae bacterium GWF2_45_14]|nr:MAG: hypothetical protein A2020_03140 [Lentisphaerae bacterium GWF2_45_14]